MQSSQETAESPLDRALSLTLAGDAEQALRWAAAVVKSDPPAPAALFLTGYVLGALGAEQAAYDALELAKQRAIDAGNLPIAIAACSKLQQSGRDANSSTSAVASAFARGSARLLPRATAPPRLGGPVPGFRPLDDAGRAALVERVAHIVLDAKMHDDVDRKREAPPKLPAQALFSSLEVVELFALIGIFEVEIVGAGMTVIEEGASGAAAYIVARGELEVERARPDGTGLRLARLGNGSLFGEMALLSRAPRAATVVAVRPSILLVATIEALERVVTRYPRIGQEFAEHCRKRMIENLIRTSAILNAVTSTERAALVERFETRSYEAGERLITQDQTSDGLHLIASGEVSVQHRSGDGSTLIAVLGPGEVVGEVALVLRRPATADVVAQHPTVTLHLPRERFLALVKQHPALLTELYELAVRREEETSSIVAQVAEDIDDLVIV